MTLLLANLAANVAFVLLVLAVSSWRTKRRTARALAGDARRLAREVRTGDEALTRTAERCSL